MHTSGQNVKRVLILTDDIKSDSCVDHSLLVGRCTHIQSSVTTLDHSEVQRPVLLTDVSRLYSPTVTVPAHTWSSLALSLAHNTF